MNSPKSNTLTEKEILKAPKTHYMNEQQLRFFKEKLLGLLESTIQQIDDAKKRMVRPMEFSDPSDRATSEEQSAIALRIIDREQKLLPKIKQALERIRLGTYGYCLETDDPIGIPRLIARPTAEFGAELKTLKEMKEHHYSN